MKRFLITTADERTWKFDRPVLFLGEWCRLYDRRHVWSGMDAEVAAPYARAIDQRKRDLAFTEALTRRLLDDTAVALNAFHGTSHATRYWNIVLGHWLRRFADTVFNRFATIEQALANHEVDGWSPAPPLTGLPTHDSLAFIYACNDDSWNHRVCARILEFLGVTAGAAPEAAAEVPVDTGPPRPRTSPARARLSAGFLSLLRRRTDAVIAQTYLGRRGEVALAVSLGQAPQLWRTPEVEAVAPSATARQQLMAGRADGTGVERLARMLLPWALPTCFLEGHAGVVRQAAALGWPECPRFVFTSNSFDTDEVFKVWCAQQAASGTPYFAGQHGSNYGTHFYAGNAAWPERAAPDRFLSWGWTDGTPIVVPAFNFKTPRARVTHPSDGGLLLMQDTISHRTTPWDTDVEFAEYYEQQFRFVAALPAAIRELLTVRLHVAHTTTRWSDAQRWRDRCPAVARDAGTTPFRELAGRSRLVVHTYDSSGMLEMMAADVPLLCFWPAGLDHVLPAARPAFERLSAAGIIIDAPEAAAAAIAGIWDDVGGWWRSPEVQTARRGFCDQFSRTTPTPVRTLRRLLIDQAAAVSAGRVTG